MSASVLIAGAGPAGLVSALCLASAGIEVTVFERNVDAAEDLRASTFHPPTLDLLSRFGITDALIEQGLIARYTQQRDRKDGLVAQFDMQHLQGETNFPFRLQCEQWKLSRLLRAKLAMLPQARLLSGATVQAVTQSERRASAEVRFGDRTEMFSGDYLIGADGAWSSVRQSLDIEFEGFTYPERFLVVSTAFEFADHFKDLSYVNYVSDPREWCVLLRVPTLWRVLFPTPPEESDAAVLSDESVERRLQSLLPRTAPYATVHRTLYKVHQRVAKQFRRARIVLAGDAAHINNPLGGMGMNGGVHDAFNVAEKLIAMIRDGVDASLLDQYERQRRSVAIEYINASTARNKKTIEERDPVARQETYDKLRAIAADPAASRDYLRKTSMIDALERANSIA